MGSDLKLTALDVPLGPERLAALALVADRWTMWIILALDERDGARFSDLAAADGLSRRVLAERLRRLVDARFITTERYSTRPLRHRYVLTDRGHLVRRMALALVHVAAGGALDIDPFTHPAAPQPDPNRDDGPGESAPSVIHPSERLLARDPAAARAMYDATLAQLVTYDDRYGSDLVATLETWFACDGSVSLTAARMYAHRHTIRYRLGRVREITGHDPATSAGREQLALGLRALRLVR